MKYTKDNVAGVRFAHGGTEYIIISGAKDGMVMAGVEDGIEFAYTDYPSFNSYVEQGTYKIVQDDNCPQGEFLFPPINQLK